MLFGAKHEWAESDPIVRAVSAPYFIFDTFEIMNFTIFYILEIMLEVEDGCTLGRLFLIEDLERVAEILADPKTKKHRLFIFVPDRYNQSGSYSVHRVQRIYKGRIEEHWGIYIFECTDRTLNNDEAARKLSGNDVICVYPFFHRQKKK
jgi:hypothetical protein